MTIWKWSKTASVQKYLYLLSAIDYVLVSGCWIEGEIAQLH